MKQKQYVPRLIFWELTEGCNLKCKHCRATAQPERSKDELTTEQALKIVDQIAEVGTKILVLTGGEPLYRPDVFEIATYANALGLTVALASNGTLIDEAYAEKIRKAGIKRVSISFDGASAQVHDSFRGIPGAFQRAIAGVKNLQHEGIEVQINSTITKHNAEQRDEIFAFAEEIDAVALHLFMLVPVGCGLEINQDEVLTSAEYEEMLTWFYHRSAQETIEFRATCAPHYYRIIRQQAKLAGESVKTTESDSMRALTKGCLAGTGVCFISHKGKVQPCGYLPLAAGDLKKQTLMEIWQHSPLFLGLRDTKNLQGKCGVCEYRNVCSGCRARAYGMTGDYMGHEPLCMYEPNSIA